MNKRINEKNEPMNNKKNERIKCRLDGKTNKLLSE